MNAILRFTIPPLLFSAAVLAQEETPELTGTVAFNVGSRSGRVERLVVTIGDGGTGKYKAVLMGDPGLPTHALYRPRDLGPFGRNNPLPIVAFANGGCRNTSGEFRNFLSDIASQGFLVIAIGPAGNAVVMGSEERTNMTAASQLLDGVTWAISENGRSGSPYYQKIDPSKVAVMGQSCGAAQAIEVSADGRVTTTIALNQGIGMGRGAGPAPNPPAATAAGRGGAAEPVRDARYAPHAPALVRAPADNAGRGPGGQARGPELLSKLHGPILFLNGGSNDSGHRTAKLNFDAVDQVPAVHAFQEVGHYPATYREANGGAFAQTAGAWLKWQLKGDPAAAKVFAGSSCGLCSDPKWTIERKRID